MFFTEHIISIPSHVFIESTDNKIAWLRYNELTDADRNTKIITFAQAENVGEMYWI